jgi:excisionase family DNA binding protein
MKNGAESVDCLVYRRDEAARRAGLSVRNLDRKVAAGEVPFKRIGRLVRFPRKAFDEWCESTTLGMRMYVGGGR